MKTVLKSSIALFTSICCFSAVAMAAELPISKLDLSYMEIGWGQPKAGKSVDGKPLKIGDQSYTDSIGTHADSSFSLVLDGKAESLIADVGVDAEVGTNGSIEFVVTTNGKEVFRSVLYTGTDPETADLLEQE